MSPVTLPRSLAYATQVGILNHMTDRPSYDASHSWRYVRLTIEPVRAASVRELLEAGRHVVLDVCAEVLAVGSGGQALLWASDLTGARPSRMRVARLSPACQAEVHVALSSGRRPMLTTSFAVLTAHDGDTFGSVCQNPQGTLTISSAPEPRLDAILRGT